MYNRMMAGLRLRMMAARRVARLGQTLSPKLRAGSCVTKCHPRRLVNLNHQTRSYVISTPSGIARQGTPKLQTLAHTSSEKVTGYELGIDGDCLKIRKGGEQLTFDITWLRDHCRCSDCFRSNAWMRLVDSADFDSDLSPNHVTLSDDNLNITWSDGHKTSYAIDWLDDIHRSSEFPRQEDTSRVLWDQNTLEASLPPDVSYNDYMGSEQGVTDLLRNLRKFGIAFLSDVPVTAAVTRKIGERVHAPLKGTALGGDNVNFIKSGKKFVGDITFENDYLPLHSDYSCNYDPSGSEEKTIFSDALRAARILRESHPEHYEALATLPVTFHKKKREGISVRCVTTIFDVREPNQDPVIIRPSNDERSILRLSAADAKRWYAAWRQFRQILTDPSSVYVLKSWPGRAIFMDNWRVAHGRLAYEGERELNAFSWSRDLVDSKMRTLGIIEESPI